MPPGLAPWQVHHPNLKTDTSTHVPLRLGVDIEQRNLWGVDCHTRTVWQCRLGPKIRVAGAPCRPPCPASFITLAVVMVSRQIFPQCCPLPLPALIWTSGALLISSGPRYPAFISPPPAPSRFFPFLIRCPSLLHPHLLFLSQYQALIPTAFRTCCQPAPLWNLSFTLTHLLNPSLLGPSSVPLRDPHLPCMQAVADVLRLTPEMDGGDEAINHFIDRTLLPAANSLGAPPPL